MCLAVRQTELNKLRGLELQITNFISSFSKPIPLVWLFACSLAAHVLLAHLRFLHRYCFQHTIRSRKALNSTRAQPVTQ